MIVRSSTDTQTSSLPPIDDLDQLHLWTVASHIILVYIQAGCITLSGILNTIHTKVIARFRELALTLLVPFRYPRSQDRCTASVEIG